MVSYTNSNLLLSIIEISGQGKGFDIDLVKLISDAVSIPVIASSGAGAADHFSEVFAKTNASAALAAGIFHRKEVTFILSKSFLMFMGIFIAMHTANKLCLILHLLYQMSGLLDKHLTVIVNLEAVVEPVKCDQT